MNEHVLENMRRLAASMQTEPQDWEWQGPYASQRMFEISEARAKEYARRYGGVARRMDACADERRCPHWVFPDSPARYKCCMLLDSDGRCANPECKNRK